MTSHFSIRNGFRPIAKEAKYQWPCADELDRTITLFDDDVLTRAEDGTYTVHTGLCCMRIRIRDDQVVPWGEEKHLVIG